MYRIVSKWMAVLALVGWAGSASATLMIELTRLSDSLVEISGSGTTDADTLALIFRDASSLGNTGTTDELTGSLLFGSRAPSDVFINDGTNDLVLFFAPPLSVGELLSGIGFITLDVETWNPVGTSGYITANYSGAVVGEFSIVATRVPVSAPATLALVGLGLARLGMSRRKGSVASFLERQ